MDARPVIDRDLADPPASLGAQDRDESVELAVEVERADAVAAIGLEAAVEVMQVDPGDPGRYAVEQLRRLPARPSP